MEKNIKISDAHLLKRAGTGTEADTITGMLDSQNQFIQDTYEQLVVANQRIKAQEKVIQKQARTILRLNKILTSIREITFYNAFPRFETIKFEDKAAPPITYDRHQYFKITDD